MALVYQPTLNESTVVITRPSPSSFALTNNPRLDSAICMPSSKKPSPCSSSVKSRCDIKKNEGLERWVEDLLKTLDNVMEKTLGTAVERNSGLRVKELIKQIDDRLSKDSSDDTIIAEEVAEDKIIDCEQLANDGLSDDASTKVHTQLETIMSYQVVTADATTLQRTLTEQKCPKSSVSKVKNLFRKKKKKTKKSVQSSSEQSTVNTKTPSKIPPKTPPKQRIDSPRQNGRKATVIGRIEKKGKWERLLNDRFLLNKREIIGEGHHGSVMRGIDLQTKEKVAIKCLRKQYKVTVGTFQVANTKQRKKNDELINEGRVMIRMESIPNLVPLLDLVETAKKVYYIMPLATKDLSDMNYCRLAERKLRKNNLSEQNLSEQELREIMLRERKLDEQKLREIMKPIFQGIKQMHDSGYVHRDIKPENILLYKGENEDDQVAKLGDFGLTTEFGCSSGFQVVGTPAFAAPEVLGQFLRTDASAWLNYKRADVWSLGATMYTTFVGRHPFDDKRTAGGDLKREVQFPEKFKHCSEDAKDLIKKMMVPDPTKRITIDDALNHPFFTNRSQ